VLVEWLKVKALHSNTSTAKIFFKTTNNTILNGEILFFPKFREK
jgi:hypothetical protein